MIAAGPHRATEDSVRRQARWRRFIEVALQAGSLCWRERRLALTGRLFRKKLIVGCAEATPKDRRRPWLSDLQYLTETSRKKIPARKKPPYRCPAVIERLVCHVSQTG